jgi:hypothetical protein
MGGMTSNPQNQGAAQNAQFTMPTYSGGGYTTTQGDNFNYTTPNAPYWGSYTDPVNITPPTPKPVVEYDRNGKPVKKGKKTKDEIARESFENPSPLPNYSMYIPPAMMPNVNAYLNSPNSLLGQMQDSGLPSSGAGRFSNLLSTNIFTGK